MSRERPDVVAIGELLWDQFPDQDRFGGAPVNFACHIASLGAVSTIISAVGDDMLGMAALEVLEQTELVTEHVCILYDQPTGTVKVTLDSNGVPTYRFNDSDAWDQIPWEEEFSEAADEADAVCFGTLGQRSETSRNTIQRFVAAVSDSALKVFDVNLRAPFYAKATVEQSLGLANVLKLNDDELQVLVDWFSIAAGDEEQQCRELAKNFELQLVALTRGSRGSLLMNEQQTSECPAPKIDVVDTVGAGDSFTAALVMGLLRGDDLDTINQFATQIAAYVCTNGGATPDLRKSGIALP